MEATADSLRRQPSLPQLKREWPPETEDARSTGEFLVYLQLAMTNTDLHYQPSTEMQRTNSAVRIHHVLPFS